MKKFLSIVLSLAMVFSMSTTAFAATPTRSMQKEIKNEYEAMMELNKNSDAQLNARGFTSDEIQTIRDYDTIYDEHINTLSTLGNDVLAEHGYTSEQIQIINTYDSKTATTNQKILSAAECETYSTIDNYTGTYGRITTEFEWTGIPAFKMTDILATAWNNWYIIGKTANVQYANIYSPNDTFWETPTYKMSDTGLESFGGSYYFSASKQDNYYYSRSGYSIFTVGCVSAQHLETAGRLGHQQGLASLSVSIRGGLDISFSVGRVSLGSGYDIAQ